MRQPPGGGSSAATCTKPHRQPLLFGTRSFTLPEVRFTQGGGKVTEDLRKAGIDAKITSMDVAAIARGGQWQHAEKFSLPP